MHTFEPKDPIEVITPHGPGVVVYVTVYGPHANDLWCVATKADGQLRHYQTIQLRLAESGVLEMNEKLAAEPVFTAGQTMAIAESQRAGHNSNVPQWFRDYAAKGRD